jgi:hypothetical protein
MVTIEEIGIDQVIVDEAQEFRKLSFATNRVNLKGVDPEGSQRAWDLYVKSRFIDQKNPRRASSRPRERRSPTRWARCKGVGVNFDLAVLISLPLDPSFPLLDLRRQPGHVEMVQGLEAQLHVHTCAHCVGRADQDADAAGVELRHKPDVVSAVARTY